MSLPLDERAAGETAAHLAEPGVAIARASERVAGVRSRLGGCAVVDIVIGIADDGRYTGAVDLGAVLRAAPDATIGTLLDPGWPAAPATMDQEQAADLAVQHRVAALPVVSEDGKPIGCIPARTLLGILSEEHQEDAHRVVGMLKREETDRHALEDPPLRRVWLRLPWLVIGLLMSTAGTALMAGYEASLKANVTIAFFIPAIVYLTDAIGTQTEAIAVRGLSQKHRPLGTILFGEMLTGALIGLVLGIIAGLGVHLAFGDMTIAIGVGLSLFAAGSMASTLGLLLPWGLSRVGVDPAFGSGPIATIIQDVLTILVYFLVMTALLPA